MISPGAAVTLGALRYDRHVVAATVVLELLPVPDRAEIVLPVGVRVEAAPGDEALVELRSGDAAPQDAPGGALVAAVGGLARSAVGALGGGGAARTVTPDTVLAGRIESIRRDHRFVVIEVVDSGADLAAMRPAATYTGRVAADVARALLRDAGVPTGDLDLDLTLGSYVASQQRTTAEHVALLAALSGAVGAVAADGTVDVVIPADRPEHALRVGRELIGWSVAGARQPRTLVTVGAGPAGAAGEPDELRVTAEALPGGVGPSADVHMEPYPMLRTPGAARAASGALTALARSRASRVHLETILVPQLRAGATLGIEDPDGLAEDAGLAGPWLIERIEHRVGPANGGTSTIDGRAIVPASDVSLTDLAGALSSAVGGLL